MIYWHCNDVLAVGDDKTKREGKGRYTKSQVGYISRIWGSDPFGPISTKIGMLVGIHDVIIQSKFGFNILRSFRSTGGRNFHFPIDFAGHRYNSAAATAQPVMHAFFFVLTQSKVAMSNGLLTFLTPSLEIVRLLKRAKWRPTS